MVVLSILLETYVLSDYMSATINLNMDGSIFSYRV